MDGEAAFWGGHAGEPVSSVNSADLKAASEAGEPMEERHGPGNVAIGTSVLEAACSPGADIAAVSYRCAILRILDLSRGGTLAQWKQGSKLHDSVFSVLATIPMVWIGEGPSEGLPFDVGAFLEELRKQTS